MADIVVTTGGNSVTNGTNFASAIASAVAGDNIILTAGATYDGSFTLSDKSTNLSNPVTIKSSATLPERRIGPGDTSLMARVRTLGVNNVAFVMAANAGGWILDGLEITENAPDEDIINSLVQCPESTNHDVIIKRCYLHGKETGSDYYRSIRWGVQWEGSGLLMKWNYIYLIGYYQLAQAADFTVLDTISMGCVGGNTVTMDDNYLSVWYNGIFTGGGDTSPQNTATLTSASTTSATFSNVTGITAGLVVRFDGTQAAMVDSVAGSVVNYTPYGVDALDHTPTAAAWNYGDQGLCYDIVLTRNTFYIDPDFALHARTNNTNFPKGYFEVKNCKRMTVEGNRFLGYPSVIVFTASNQNGTAPWTTTSDVIIRNNWIGPPDAEGKRAAIILSNNSYVHTDTPSQNILIENNLFKNVQNLAYSGNLISNLDIVHNTIINSIGGFGTNVVVLGETVSTGFMFRDNIVAYLIYGMSCLVSPNTLATCWPSGVFANNVVIDADAQGFSSTVWGSGGILTPIPAAFADVGFVNAAADDYTLDVSSDYKGLGTDDTDPGVNMAILIAALGSDNVGRKTKKGNVTKGRH